MKCKNCQKPLLESDSFCNICGAKVIRNRITFKQIFHDFSEQFLNYDNKFLQTFLKLFTDPNDVITSYLQGTRKKYVNVISYFAIAITFSGIQIFIMNKFFPEIMDLSAISAEGTAEFSNKNMQFINEYQSIVMMLYIPIYAFMAKLVFLNKKKFNYTELIVIFAYILSQISIVSTIITIIFGLFGVTLGYIAGLLLLIQIIYSAYCLKHLYGLSTKGIILRTLLFFVILSIFFLVGVIIAAFVMAKTGRLQEFREAQEAAQQNVSYIASSVINWTS